MDRPFKDCIKDVTALMGKDKRDEVRRKIYDIEDIEPLFAPHTFWETQPVPQPGDELNLPESCFDTAIRVQTLDEVRKEPYALPEGFHWAELDLNNDQEA